MAINWQKGTLFAAGLAVGVAGGVWGVMSFKDGNHAQPRPPAQAASTSTMGAPAATPTVAIAAPPGTCEQAPMLAKSDDGDGRESLLPKGGTASAGEVAAMILSGKEAAASGRARDAEVVFLNACRQAASLAGNERIALADSMYQLGRHYANVAALGAPKSRELFERAERLYSASLEAYTARYGANHEKTKFAQGGLTTVLQATGGSGVAAVAKAAPAAAPVQAAPPPVQVAQAAPSPPVMPSPPVARVEPPPPPAVHAPPPPPAVVHAPPPPVVHAPPLVAAAPSAPAHRSAATPPPAVAPAVPRETTVARRTSPSFDCAKARSTTEKLICGDEELARMDRELGGIHQRAKQAAADPRAFQRNSDAEWQRRENTCRDAECLRRWYAQRRQDLSTAAAAPSQPRVEASRPAEPRVAERRTHVAEPVARAATKPRPRPQLRQEPSEVTIAPGVASGDSGLSEPPAARWRPARQADSRGAPSAEGSPNTVE